MSDDVTLQSVGADDPNLIKLGRVKSTVSNPPPRLGTDPKKPDYECDFHFDQMGRWRMIDALWDGTEGMRLAGKTLLPRYTFEEQDVWQRRLEGAVLFNAFRKTVQSYVGKPFAKPIEIPDDMPEMITDAIEDVDDQGTSFDLFAQVAFERAMAKGIVHTLIDFPPAVEGETAADEADKQPCFTIVQPENLIGARCDADGCLTMVRIREITMEPDDAFGEKQVVRIRVLEKDKWTLYRQEKKRWVKEGSGKNTLEEIPFVTFYVDKEGFMRSRPPLLDLAYKNVEHWQSSSDQRNILSICRFPMLVGTGVNPHDPLVIGPNNYFAFRDKDANLKFVEHGGNAISAGRQDLEDLKAEMAVLGLSLVMPAQPGTVTATAKAMDGAESITELQRIVMAYTTFLNETIYWTARWLGMSHEDAKALPQVQINSDYTKLLGMDSSIQALLTARGSRDISRKALIDALKRRSLLPADFDADEDQEQLDEEAKNTGGGLPPATGKKFGLLPGKKADEEKDPTQLVGSEKAASIAGNKGKPFEGAKA